MLYGDVYLALGGTNDPGGLTKPMEPHWASYVGMATGIVGALTGVAGSIMGWIAYRRSNQLKTSDRRLELNKLRNSAHAASTALLDLLPQAIKSRLAVMNARGVLRSGMTRQFEEQYEKDLSRARELAEKIPSTEENFESLSIEQVEERIVQLHRTQQWIDELLRKYKDHMAEDAGWRAELRNDHRGRHP